MSKAQLRENAAPLPASLGRRNQPRLTLDEMGARSPGYRILAAPVIQPGIRQPAIVSSVNRLQDAQPTS